MGDWPNALDAPIRGVVSSAGKPCGVGTPYVTGPNWTNLTAWPAANRALFLPIIIPDFASVVAFGWENGATLGGNVDVGLYDINSAKVISKGSTAQAGASAFQAVTVAATPVAPGNYWLAMISDSATATFRNETGPTAAGLTVMGMQQQATSIPLPATATLANVGSAYIPLVVMALGQAL